MVVDLGKHTCTYRFWQLTGMPCMHAISAIQDKNGKRTEEYCHELLTMEAYKRTYYFNVNPVKGQDMWEITSSPAPVPPPIKPKPERPTKKRRKDKGEQPVGSSTKIKRKYNPIRCMYCGEVGHNKRSCAKKKKEDAEEQARQMQLQLAIAKGPAPPTDEPSNNNEVQSHSPPSPPVQPQPAVEVNQPGENPPMQDTQLPVQDLQRGRSPKLHVIKSKARSNAYTQSPVAISVETLKGTTSATAKKMQTFMTFVPTPGFKRPRKKD
ncbi:uncharacterized protein LOC110270346 isoform X2 [Arachis ipaensis]|uniref:uncharacterized protein LOC110270346 isoform X2 n=1 Tax=Arachis ipaensis TaxID=130454 RepID=UPI000A2B0885|nr:uncharacterized protein LOC110270346 isoform X2 [Arachis ipaensis]